MTREEFVVYLNQKDFSRLSGKRITLNDLVFIRNYIHYRKKILVSMEEIESAAKNNFIRFSEKLDFAIQACVNHFEINSLHTKEGDLIKYI